MLDKFILKIKKADLDQSWSDVLKHRLGASCGSNKFRYYTAEQKQIIIRENFIDSSCFLPLTEDDDKLIADFFKNRFKNSQRNKSDKNVKVIYEDEDGEQEAIMKSYEVARWVAFQENQARQEGYFKFIRTEDCDE